MTFVRKKPIGWTDDVDVLKAAEINGIDADLANAVDGASGGTYPGDQVWTGAHTFEDDIDAGADDNVDWKIERVQQTGTGTTTAAAATLKGQDGRAVAAGTNNSGGPAVLQGGAVGTGGTGGQAGVVRHSVGGVVVDYFGLADVEVSSTHGVFDIFLEPGQVCRVETIAAGVDSGGGADPAYHVYKRVIAARRNTSDDDVVFSVISTDVEDVGDLAVQEANNGDGSLTVVVIRAIAPDKDVNIYGTVFYGPVSD
jgi:hypothetical protein